MLLLHNYESCQGPLYKAKFDLYKLRTTPYSALWLWLEIANWAATLHHLGYLLWFFFYGTGLMA